MTNIEGILFDWGGVLVDNPTPGAVAYCASALGVSAQDYTRAHTTHGEAFQRGAISEETFWQRVCGDLGRPVPDRASLWGDAFRAAYAPREQVFALVRRLREKEYRTSLLSNTEAVAMEFFLGLDYDGFDALTFSCAEGMAKPEPGIYEVAARKLALRPADCVLIDDRLDFIEGARQVGMQGILYQDLQQVRQDLTALGVQIE